MISKINFKGFSALLLVVLTSSSILLGTSAFAQSSQVADCNTATKADIAYAQTKSLQRRKEVSDRFQFANAKLVLAKNNGNDITSLAATINPLKTKLKTTQSSYQSWIDATKKIDCSNDQTASSTRALRDTTHDKAWADFKDFMIYYNESVRPLYRTFTYSNTANNKIMVNQIQNPSPVPKSEQSKTLKNIENLPKSI
jgi:outer membrane PBP1 activator LpoA protein